MKIYYWADGTWCESSEVASMSHKSDDYGVLEFDDADSWEDWQVDMFVQEKLG